ncbi:MAG TPA: SMP-30/gluconolactonase/LRE family protein [Limnochordia bacterium]|nr:SMP-30/gluconolactonase/LRE family protein [Limnochordia bacterium]
MSAAFERVAGPFAFTEGPLWWRDAVLFTDIPTSRILRYDPAGGECTVWREGTNGANGLAADADGRVIACEGDARRLVRYEPDGAVSVLAERFEGKRLNSPNDVIIDRAGRIWFSDPRYGDRTGVQLEPDSIYRLTPQAGGAFALERLTFDTTRPNGLALSPDERTLYVAQSEYGDGKARELRAYPVRDDGTLGAYRVLHDFYPHRGIDGMKVTPDGRIVAACGWSRSGPGPRIAIFTPDGELAASFAVPVDQPSNCAFAPDGSTLYVTAGGCLWRLRFEEAP